MAPDLGTQDFRLGDVRVQPARLVVEIDGSEQRLEPRVMELLVLLPAEPAGETVSREPLRDTQWASVVPLRHIPSALRALRHKLHQGHGGHS